MGANTPSRMIVHAGFHKTGTTSLQLALRAHARKLAPQWHVAVLQGGTRGLRAAANAARAYSARPDNAALAQFSSAFTLWAETIPPGQSVLLSSEDFAGHMPGTRGVRAFGAAAPLAATMAKTLMRRFDQIDFLYTTRDAESWLPSIHWQMAKHDNMLLSAEPFARRFAAAADFAPVIAAIRAAQPHPVHAVSLESLTNRRLGPVEAIYDLAALPEDLRAALAPLPPANTSPTFDMAEVFVALNRTEMPTDIRRQMKAALSFMARPEPGLDEPEGPL